MKVDGPAIRAELVIATLALLTSACASIAAIFQTREAAVQTSATIAQARTLESQLGASVWPYLTVNDAFSPHGLVVTITNQGLGPALIRSFTLSFDRTVQTRFHDFVTRIDPNSRGRKLDYYTLEGGSVIRPSQRFTLFSVTDPSLSEPHVEAVMERARIDLCYCSLLGECWSLDSKEMEPRRVDRCGPPTRALST